MSSTLWWRRRIRTASISIAAYIRPCPVASGSSSTSQADLNATIVTGGGVGYPYPLYDPFYSSYYYYSPFAYPYYWGAGYRYRYGYPYYRNYYNYYGTPGYPYYPAAIPAASTPAARATQDRATRRQERPTREAAAASPRAAGTRACVRQEVAAVVVKAPLLLAEEALEEAAGTSGSSTSSSGSSGSSGSSSSSGSTRFVERCVERWLLRRWQQRRRR